MKKLICFLSLFVSLSVSALDGHPVGENHFCCRNDKYIGLWGKIRIVGKNESADLNVYVWAPGKKANIIPGTPEMVVKRVESGPYWVGEFQIVNSGEWFTVKIMDHANGADLIVVLGEPRKSYPSGYVF